MNAGPVSLVDLRVALMRPTREIRSAIAARLSQAGGPPPDIVAERDVSRVIGDRRRYDLVVVDERAERAAARELIGSLKTQIGHRRDAFGAVLVARGVTESRLDRALADGFNCVVAKPCSVVTLIDHALEAVRKARADWQPGPVPATETVLVD